MISIVIPVYNQAEKLKKCLASIVAQSCQDYELIIVDDGSTDDVSAVVKSFEVKFSNKIKFIQQANQGANAARNRGAREALGEYIIFCDADIVLKPEMLATLLAKLEARPEAAYVYSSFKFGWKKFRAGEFTDSKLQAAPFIHTTALIRTKAFPVFDEKLKRFQDWDLWLTMLEQGKRGVFVDEVLFRVASGGTMSAWLPSFVYKLAPGLNQVKKYQAAEKLIKQKHGLS